ncbi:hypothetical protein ACUC9H_08020, partial [Neisseria meningitidis]
MRRFIAVSTCFKADKGAETVNNDTEHNATYFSHFPSKQKTKKHRRQPMPLPLQVSLFYFLATGSTGLAGPFGAGAPT